MPKPFGIFSLAGGTPKLLRTSSVRASRANHAALEAAKHYPQVFYARLDGEGNPSGEHFQPRRGGPVQPARPPRRVRQSTIPASDHQPLRQRVDWDTPRAKPLLLSDLAED